MGWVGRRAHDALRCSDAAALSSGASDAAVRSGACAARAATATLLALLLLLLLLLRCTIKQEKYILVSIIVSRDRKRYSQAVDVTHLTSTHAFCSGVSIGNGRKIRTPGGLLSLRPAAVGPAYSIDRPELELELEL